MTTITVIFLIIAIVAIGAALWMYLLVSRTRRLRSRFGPEYDRTLEQVQGQTRRAETLLEGRQERVEKLNIRPLSREDRDLFLTEWRGVQAKFVDDPPEAVKLADSVITRVMQARNYPVADFEQRAADISVGHPEVVQDYRVAHQIATDPRRDSSTEDLRKAMQHYRSLFEGLVEAPVSHERVYR